MVQKYQNESAPIFYYGKSPKTIRKHLNIPYLQALTLGRIIKRTLYLVCWTTVGVKSHVSVFLPLDEVHGHGGRHPLVAQQAAAQHALASHPTSSCTQGRGVKMLIKETLSRLVSL